MKANYLINTIAVISCLVAVNLTASTQNLIVNGGFEDPVVPTGHDRSARSVSMPGWSIGNPNGGTSGVDLVATMMWAPYSGAQSLDLISDFCTVGNFIQQDVQTVAGQAYSLSLYYANNVDATETTARILVLDGAQTLFDTTLTHTTSTRQDMDWTLFEGNFTATSSSTSLMIIHEGAVGSSVSRTGMALDDVSLAPVPEPTGLAPLALGGICGGLFLRRRD